MGRLQAEQQPDGTTLSYGYDAAGNRVELNITNNGQQQRTRFEFDALGRLHKVIAPDGGETGYSYDAVGNRQSLRLANGVVSHYEYDSLNRLQELRTEDGQGQLLQGYSYQLDATGRRQQVNELHRQRVTRYHFDDGYRLIGEEVSSDDAVIYQAEYGYDAVGNRVYSIIDGVHTQYSVDDNDRLLGQGETSYSYDANGNTLSETTAGVEQLYSYDAANRLQSFTAGGTTTHYSYNSDGIRIGEQSGASNRRYVVDSNRDYAEVVQEWQGSTLVANYLHGDELLAENRGGQYAYPLHDGHGSVRALSSGSGSLTDSYDYDAFGVAQAASGSSVNPYRYSGEWYDSTLGQYYLRARYYAPQMGRFSQMDSWQGNNHDPITLHKYAYGNVDPVTYTDPTGNFSLGSVSAGINIQGVLTTASIASSGYSLYSASTDDDGLTAKEAGFAFLIAAAGPAGGKLVKLLGNSNAAKKLCENVCGLLNKSNIIGASIKFRSPESIAFTQSSIKSTFRDGRSVDDLISGLKTGAIKPDSLPPIRIFRKDGKIYSLDNRRLYAAKQAGVKVKTVGATEDEVLREAWKFTTKNGGASISYKN